ncbi:recombinase family protein [Heliobacterium chlorum]|uniref:Recombinase family protein n=1 Tax=Heliobacterium chlorum TaxID=2698 RepID=A0ABR7T5S3_HELCL|nr:recombinase family protein [Heliobacterium chlorum]MBC9785363.1 recombinase family protein [Heliobacterium chlorum]
MGEIGKRYATKNTNPATKADVTDDIEIILDDREIVTDDLVIKPRQSGNFETLTDIKSTLNMPNLFVGGYIRVSTAKEGQKTSIENQEKYIREWCEVNGYQLHQVYIDVKSGQFARLRSDLNKMLADIEEKKICGIVTKEIARSSRDVMDTLELKRNMSDQGAFLISIRENYDSRTDDDEFLLIIHAALAQKERKTTSSRIKVTQMLKAKEGRGNVPPPYGYRYGEDGRYLPDPIEAPVYRKIIENFLNDRYGRLKIAKELNRENIPGPRGGKWCPSSVKFILENPVYLGIMIYNTTTLVRTASGERKRVIRPQQEWVIVHEAHPPLITKKKFDRVQDLIRRRREKDNRDRSCFERKYLLSGLVYCGVCGGRMHGSFFRQRYKVKSQEEKECFLYRYVCQGKNGRCDRPTKYYKMNIIDQMILKEVTKVLPKLIRPEEVGSYVQRHKDFFHKNLSKERKEREQLKVLMEKNKKAVLLQQVAYEEEVIDLNEYKIRLAKLREEKEDLVQKLERLNQKMACTDSTEDNVQAITLHIMSSLGSVEQLSSDRKRTLIDQMISRVDVYSQYEIAIHWSFENLK